MSGLRLDRSATGVKEGTEREDRCVSVCVCVQRDKWDIQKGQGLRQFNFKTFKSPIFWIILSSVVMNEHGRQGRRKGSSVSVHELDMVGTNVPPLSKKNGEMKRKSDLSFFEGEKYLFPAASPVTNPLPYKPLFPRSTIGDFLGETISLESVLNYFCVCTFLKKNILKDIHIIL